jgi:plasmid stabilization system protein ParE
MQIIKDTIFENSLKKILKYISVDSKTKAKKFNISLLKKVKKLPDMPYKFRQSLYYDSSDIRDLIFKGYTIPYLIDKDKKCIVILDIFKWIDR